MKRLRRRQDQVNGISVDISIDRQHEPHEREKLAPDFTDIDESNDIKWKEV